MEMDIEKSKKKIINITISLTVLLSVILRIWYIYYTPVWRRQHDVIDFGADEGQAAFIEYFHQGHLLLNFDPREKWGFFQPPLHHMIAAAFIHILEFFGIAYRAACEHVQILTLVYSLITLFFAYLIFKYLGLAGEAMLISFAIAAAHPGFILMSGSINNDMLAIMLTVMTIYFGLKWDEDPSWMYTVILAFTIGFGMMAKLSSALIAPAVALIFIIKWIRGGTESFVPYMKKFVVFAFICGPLALWSPVRNYIRFGVPISYTPEVGEEISQSLAARIFDVRSSIPYVSRISNGDAYDEFNMLLGMMKTSLFGDENFALAMSEAGHSGSGAFIMTLWGWILLLSGTLLAFLCFYSSVRVLASDKYLGSITTRTYLAAVYVISLIMYVYFMITAPYYSSMDFRYVLYLIPLQALAAGIYSRSCSSLFRKILLTDIGVFGAAVFILYILLGLA